MATYRCIICENCRMLIIHSASDKCPICKEKRTGKEAGVPIITNLQMEGRSPTPDEIDRLKTTPFSRKSLSSGERNKSVFNIILGLFLSPLMFLFGLWVIRTFVGPGVIFSGYGALIAAPIFAVLFVGMGFNTLLRDPRKKTVFDTFLWIWKESYASALENDDESNCKYAYGCAMRSVPEVINNRVNKEMLKEFLLKTRETFLTILNKTSEGVNTSFKRKDRKVVNPWRECWELSEESFRLSKKEETENDVSKVSGRFTFKKVLSLTEGEDTYELHIAALLVTVNSYYIRNGKFWFAYDLMPEIKSVEKREV